MQVVGVMKVVKVNEFKQVDKQWTGDRRSEEESAGRVAWAETSVRGDLWEKDSSKSER